jgi:excisionase family DNA binding protein
MTTTAKSVLEPVVPGDTDISQAREAVEALAKFELSVSKIVIEDRAHRMDLLREMAKGHAISLVPMHAELTTQQAADALNVSRPFLVQLLEAGALPFRRVGTHRRIRFDDLMRYRRTIDSKRAETLRKLAEDSEALGLYE